MTLSIFKDLFCEKPISNYSLRNKKCIYEPFFRTKFNQFCIAYRAPYLWNNIVLPNFDILYTFKHKLKSLILSIDDVIRYF